MKLTYAILAGLILLSLAVLIAHNAHGCAEGTIEYRGDCYRNFRPTEDSNTDYPVRRQWESDEKPPTDKMPSWEREGIKADPGIRAAEPSTPVANDYSGERNQK